MKKLSILLGAILVLALLLACGPTVSEPVPTTLPALPKASLIPNPVETSSPIYGGTIEYGFDLPRNFDAHQRELGGPQAALPIFNQLVMFDINYKEAVPETIIGDLAESWETSPDGKAITFHLKQGVKWHDGVPFTAADVVYSLDKMTDPYRSAISGWFPAYAGLTEKIDAYTVKVHLKYPSAGFMLALAQGESVIQAKHLAGTDPKTTNFLIGTGPFMFKDFKVREYLKYKRNPDYWKKDKAGNQLPYLDGIIFYKMSEDTADNALVTRKLDIMSPIGGTSNADHLRYWERAAGDLRWLKRETNNGVVLFLNTKHPPLDDIRIRRALSLVIEQEDLVIAYGADPAWCRLGVGLLGPSIGLPSEEVTKLMGWDEPYEERVAEARKLMGLAGYGDGFKLKMLTPGATAATSSGNTGKEAGVTRVIMDVLRRQLKIDVEVSMGLQASDLQKRLKEDSYDIYTFSLDLRDPVELANYFATGGSSNYSNYFSPELDKMLAELDYILDLAKRREAIWEIERTLLIDKPALPTGAFVPTMIPYYPYVKNLRVNGIVYSNINRMEDVWLDESLRVK